MSLQSVLRYPQHFSFSSLTKQGIPELQTGVTKFPFQAVPSQRFSLIRGFSARNAELIQEGSHSYSGYASDKSSNCSLRVHKAATMPSELVHRRVRTVMWNLSSRRATFSEDLVRWETATGTSEAQGWSQPAGWMEEHVLWQAEFWLRAGCASQVPQVGLASILALFFLSKLLELTRARRVTDCQRVMLHILEC